MRIGLVFACVVCVVLSLSTPARAQLHERSLGECVSLSTGDPCMVGELLVARIAHWLHHEQVDARIGVRVLDRSGQLSFEIDFQDRVVAERTFAVLPRDCAARRDAFALAVSLALDNVVQRREEIAAEIAATTPPETVNASTDPAVAAEASAGSDRAEHGLQLGLVLGAAALAHGLPGFAALGEGAVELSSGWFMARLGALASTPGTVGFQGGEVASRLLGGRADVCLLDPIGNVLVSGCVGAQMGVVHMVGRDFTSSTSSVQPWVANAVRVAFEWPRDTVRARLFLEGMMPLLSPAARVVDTEGATLGKLTTVRVGVILGVQALVVFR